MKFKEYLDEAPVNSRNKNSAKSGKTALDAFLASSENIRDKLKQLQKITYDHFNQYPESINWGHAGDLTRIESGLDELITILKKSK